MGYIDYNLLIVFLVVILFKSLRLCKEKPERSQPYFIGCCFLDPEGCGTRQPACFVTKMGDVSIPIDDKLRLECRFTGSPKLFVVWYKDGKQIYGSYRYNREVTDNTCILKCLHECDQDTPGKYTCEISNAYGSDICHAQVSVDTG